MSRIQYSSGIDRSWAINKQEKEKLRGEIARLKSLVSRLRLEIEHVSLETDIKREFELNSEARSWPYMFMLPLIELNVVDNISEGKIEGVFRKICRHVNVTLSGKFPVRQTINGWANTVLPVLNLFHMDDGMQTNSKGTTRQSDGTTKKNVPLSQCIIRLPQNPLKVYIIIRYGISHTNVRAHH